jgi:starch synthase
MQVYFIDNEDYFQRKFLFSNDNGEFFDDNDERIIFFARGVIETVKKLQWPPSIIHCHGWFSALVSLYIKRLYYDDPVFKNAKVILSLYSTEFTQPLSKFLRKKLRMDGIPDEDLKIIEDPNYLNYCKLVINMSDGLIIGSEQINKEVQKYMVKSGKPLLPYQNSDAYIESYSSFYDLVMNGSY